MGEANCARSHINLILQSQAALSEVITQKHRELMPAAKRAEQSHVAVAGRACCMVLNHDHGWQPHLEGSCSV
jgi:hypothetical protein